MGIAIADVSDKGAPAALYMAMVRSLLRSKSDQAEDPASVLAEVNRDLLVQSSAEMFVTIFYAVLDPSTRTLTYTNAGHPPPLLRRPTNQVISLDRGGQPLGMFDEIHSGEREPPIFSPRSTHCLHGRRNRGTQSRGQGLRLCAAAQDRRPPAPRTLPA